MRQERIEHQRCGINTRYVACNFYVSPLGGMTTLYDNDHNLLASMTLNNFGDTLLIEDDKLYHGVSPISIEAEDIGIRDVLIVEFY